MLNQKSGSTHILTTTNPQLVLDSSNLINYTDTPPRERISVPKKTYTPQQIVVKTRKWFRVSRTLLVLGIATAALSAFSILLHPTQLTSQMNITPLLVAFIMLTCAELASYQATKYQQDTEQ